ncbi:hypothetical protein [Nannocystis bainbridge]|uniref:Uncharacterized protein n=1 Tax=Nannocystis bainbridge TaxID=2995303 RepID=A0ABT5DZL1_9BACT|nr:hypothetical protein [Nannocystis bainbridge]MDC0719065.1 hypothetical protein [Nannocystis bainbridge]
MTTASAKKFVLLVGLDPAVVDFSQFPGLDAPKLAAGLQASLDATTAAGFDAEWCLITDRWPEAEPVLRARLTARPPAAVMIGAGIRTQPAHLLLFERIVNLVQAVAPGASLCFSTSPDSAADAVLRWVRP